MLIGDDRFNSITLIVENNHVKKHIMAFYINIILGKIIKIINPSFEGYYKEIPLLKCEGIVPATNLIFNISRIISMNNISDERYIFSKFTTTNYQVKSLIISEILYSGAYNSRHGTDCYCLKISNSNSVVIGLNFLLNQYESIIFKPFVSAKLGNLLVHRDVLDIHFKSNRTYHLRDLC